jgi:copper oxidase (laccase) domain-containing protein
MSSEKEQEFPHRAVVTSGWRGEAKNVVSARMTATQLVTKRGTRYSLRTGRGIGGSSYNIARIVFSDDRTDQSVRDARGRLEAEVEAKKEAKRQRRNDQHRRQREARELAEQQKRENLAGRIVQAIEDDLIGRRGFGSVWDMTDEGIQQEIRAEWRRLAVEELGK